MPARLGTESWLKVYLCECSGIVPGCAGRGPAGDGRAPAAGQERVQVGPVPVRTVSCAAVSCAAAVRRTWACRAICGLNCTTGCSQALISSCACCATSSVWLQLRRALQAKQMPVLSDQQAVGLLPCCSSQHAERRDRVGHMHETPQNVVADFFGRARFNDKLGNLDLPGIKHANPAFEAEEADAKARVQPQGEGAQNAGYALHSEQP